MDSIADMSSHLCQVMGLPSRDWVDSSDKRAGEDHNILSVPGSPGM